MTAMLHDTSLVEDIDFVSIANGAQTMRYADGGTMLTVKTIVSSPSLAHASAASHPACPALDINTILFINKLTPYFAYMLQYIFVNTFLKLLKFDPANRVAIIVIAVYFNYV